MKDVPLTHHERERRERIATACLAAIITASTERHSRPYMDNEVAHAIEYANALIRELDK